MNWKIFKHISCWIPLAPPESLVSCSCLFLQWPLNLHNIRNLHLGVPGIDIRTLGYWRVHSCLYPILHIVNGRRSLGLRVLLFTLRSTSYSGKVIGADFLVFFNFGIIRAYRIRSKLNPNSGLTPKNLSPQNFFKSRIVHDLISVLVHFEPQYDFECFVFV